jgi:Rrf2 family protein
MPVLFSRACEYGVRALVEMARNEDTPLHLAQDLAQRLKIPAPFLAKTLQLLAKEGILHSTKGRKGGFSLARPAREIKLIEIVRAVDGLSLVNDCVLGMPSCGDAQPCAAHANWAEIRTQIAHLLSTTTLYSAAKDAQ